MTSSGNITFYPRSHISPDYNPQSVSKNLKNLKSVEVNLDVRLSELDASKTIDPEEVDLEIHGGRVLAVLSTTIQQLKIMTSIPKLLSNDAELLGKYFETEELEYVTAVFTKNDLDSNSRNLMEKSQLFKAVSRGVDRILLTNLDLSMLESTRASLLQEKGIFQSKRNKRRSSYNKDEDLMMFDPHLSHVMGMLWANNELRQTILENYPNLVEQESITFIDCIRNLRNIAQKKLSVSAAEQRVRERELQIAWKNNEIMDEKILNAEAQLEKQRDELGHQLAKKNEKIEEYLLKIKTIQENFSDDIKRKVNDSEKQMNADTLESKEKQLELAGEAKNVTQQYESLLSQHLAYEKTLRAKRLKVEAQLCSWLAKYDADIGEKQAQFEEITQGYEKEKAEMEALQKEFNMQAEEYLSLMTEKEEEERRIYEEKAYIFLCNRAARRIQRYWRAYRQRKKDRKKARKAKAKPKAN